MGIIYFVNTEKLAQTNINDVICINNTAKIGSFIYSEAYNDLSLRNIFCTQLYNNAIYFMWTFKILFSFVNGTFTNGTSTKAPLIFFEAELILNNIILHDYLIDSNLMTINFCDESILT